MILLSLRLLFSFGSIIPCLIAWFLFFSKREGITLPFPLSKFRSHACFLTVFSIVYTNLGTSTAIFGKSSVRTMVSIKLRGYSFYRRWQGGQEGSNLHRFQGCRRPLPWQTGSGRARPGCTTSSPQAAPRAPRDQTRNRQAACIQKRQAIHQPNNEPSPPAENTGRGCHS